MPWPHCVQRGMMGRVKRCAWHIFPSIREAEAFRKPWAGFLGSYWPELDPMVSLGCKGSGHVKIWFSNLCSKREQVGNGFQVVHWQLHVHWAAVPALALETGSVPWGCNVTVPQTGGLKTTEIDSHSSGGLKSEMKVLAGLVFSEAFLLGL